MSFNFIANYRHFAACGEHNGHTYRIVRSI